MAAVYVTQVLSALDQTIVGTALPKIVAQLHGEELYAWVFSAYHLGGTATVTVVGKFSDLFGRKRIVLLSVALFSLGSMLCGASQSMLAMVLFRAVQGVGAGGVIISALAIVGDLFTPRERAKWQSVNSLAFATASAIGPAVGGFVSDTWSWRWIFYLNMPLAVAALLALTFALPPLQTDRRPFVDWRGAALAISGVLCLMLALTWGGRQFAWLSPPILALLAVAAGAGLSFGRVERAAKEPIVPPGLLRGPVVPFCCIGMFTMGLVWFGMILLGPLFLQDVLGLSATRSGGDLTPAVVLSGGASGLAGWVISRSGRCKPTLIAGALTTLAGVAWLLAVDPSSSELSVDGALILVGLGIGWVIVPFILALQNAVPPSQQGVTMGVMSLFRQTGATLGTTMLSVFVSGSVAELAPEELSQAIHAGLWVLFGASLLMVLMTLLVRDVPLRGKAALQPAQAAS